MADDTARGSRTRRTVLVALAIWLAVVLAVSALTWFAIGRAGSEVLAPSAQQVPTSTAATGGTVPTTSTAPAPTAGTTGTAATTGATTSPATSGPPTTAPPTSAPPAATPVDEVVTVAGGQAQFRCTGDVLSAPFATPATGWSVRKDPSDGGARIRVEFESEEQRFRIEAVCVGGEPSVTVESGGHGGGGDD